MAKDRRFRKCVVRMILGLTALAVCALVFGVVYQANFERGLTARLEPPGQLVDIGSHHLHLYCTGTGEPPVALLSGSGLAYDEWSWEGIQADLSEITQACSYDRAGLGWSDRGPEPPSANQAVEELFTLLNRSGIDGPWIVAGHSLGGLYAQQLMNVHPEVVAALVLIEPTPDDMFEREPQELERFERAPLAAVFDAISNSRPLVGLQQFWWDRRHREPETSKWWVEKRLYRTVKHQRTATAEWQAIPESCEQVQAAGIPWGDIPLVLSLGQLTWSSMEQADIAWARELVGRSSRGRIEVVEGAGHGIPWERGDAVVVAVDSIIRTLRQTNDSPG